MHAGCVHQDASSLADAECIADAESTSVRPPSRKYLVRGRRPPSQTWRTFLRNHVGQIVAADFFVVPTATCPRPNN
jgi:hypothetical protein